MRDNRRLCILVAERPRMPFAAGAAQPGMTMSKILTKAADIRQWVEARGGNPILLDMPDGTGSRTLLQLTFGQHFLNADENEGPDRPSATSW